MSTRKQKDFYIELLRFYSEFARFGGFLHSNREVSSMYDYTINRLLVLCGLIIELIEKSCPDDIQVMFRKYGK